MRALSDSLPSSSSELPAAQIPLSYLQAVASELTPHAVARLRTARLARSTRPFLARGGPRGERCEACRLRPSHCMCALRPELGTRAAFCLLMHDSEPLKPSNTGWLIADVVKDTFAYGWSRTEIAPQLQALLNDPQWQPFVVFPGEYAQPPERVVHVGEEVNVKVLELNAAKNRIGLSRKGAIADQERENIKAYTRKNDEKSSGLSLGDALKAAMKTKPE